MAELLHEPAEHEAWRRRRVRRSAFVLTLVVLAFYLGFIVMAVSRGTS